MAIDEDMIIPGLWNDHINATSYPNETLYYEQIFKQYTMYVEMANAISDRRDRTNSFFLTLNTIIVAALSIGSDYINSISVRWLLLFPLLVIFLMLLIWGLLINSYKRLNGAKYKVIGEFERRLPASPYWSAEWKALGEGKESKKYIPLTHIETWIPIIFGAFYLVIAVIYCFCI